MKFGVRECCDVVLRAKSAQKIGHKIFYKDEPVCYFDTLKTSTFEGAATTVYAQGGRGNARLMSWDGERTVTFTMEDALISPIGLSILTGAGLIEATSTKPIVQHVLETNQELNHTVASGKHIIFLQNNPYLAVEQTKEPTIYVMITDENGEVVSEPYLFVPALDSDFSSDFEIETNTGKVISAPTAYTDYIGTYAITLAAADTTNHTRFKYEQNSKYVDYNGEDATNPYTSQSIATAKYVVVDYYTEVTQDAMQIDITPDKFGGTFYLEASTLWRDQGSGQDLPAEFIIPKCKIQSNFSFTLSSSGDPSSFTFTMDAFPDYTRFDREKVLARIQVIGVGDSGVKKVYRSETWSNAVEKSDGSISATEGT